MKIKTKKQLLVTIILLNLAVFSAIGAVLWYYDGIRVLAPLMGAAAVVIVMQYNSREKQFTEVK